MRVLIAGIAGLLARKVAQRLLAAGHEVIGIDPRPWPGAPAGMELHAVDIRKRAAEEVFRMLATPPAAERRHNPGLDPGRVDVIVGGAIVVVAVMRHWGFDELLVSEADILDGLARTMA